jgi:predicted DsbA family dithiol-disulfide isomerase
MGAADRIAEGEMSSRVKIDFVSDVVCPWCVIGLRSLETALARIGSDVTAEIHLLPFELNPQMPASGQDIHDYFAEKYGGTPEQFERNREAIRIRGEQLGFTFQMDKRSRIYNTFDAHRLLHWAEGEGRQRELKHALFEAYFTEGRNPSDHTVLIEAAGQVGLDTARAAEILRSGAYANEVRKQERYYAERGISAVPSVIINDRHLIQGGQPAEVFEQAIRRLIAPG